MRACRGGDRPSRSLSRHGPPSARDSRIFGGARRLQGGIRRRRICFPARMRHDRQFTHNMARASHGPQHRERRAWRGSQPSQPGTWCIAQGLQKIPFVERIRIEFVPTSEIFAAQGLVFARFYLISFWSLDDKAYQGIFISISEGHTWPTPPRIHLRDAAGNGARNGRF